MQERLTTWGACIRPQRLTQRIASLELARRMCISRATLQRLEHGDPGASVANYLRAFMVLGVLDEVAPALPLPLWAECTRQRVGHPGVATGNDDDYF